MTRRFCRRWPHGPGRRPARSRREPHQGGGSPPRASHGSSRASGLGRLAGVRWEAAAGAHDRAEDLRGRRGLADSRRGPQDLSPAFAALRAFPHMAVTGRQWRGQPIRRDVPTLLIQADLLAPIVAARDQTLPESNLRQSRALISAGRCRELEACG